MARDGQRLRHAFRNPRIATLLGQSIWLVPAAQREKVIDALIDLYDDETSDDARREVRRAFLMAIEGAPVLLENERYSGFLLDHVEPEDFAALPAPAPERIASYYEGLYSLRFDTDEVTEQVRNHAHMLLRGALQEYEEANRMEEMLRLLQIVPRLPGVKDAEISRIRNRVYLYEMRRVRRNRSLLRAILILQAVMIFVVFPVLFINAENGRLQRQIEAATKLDIHTEQYEQYSFLDGVYWSVITAFSIGYGDTVPHTWLGKLLAMLLGIMGVLTTGIIAGLILNWVTPRSFP
jgi:hypothetical protein